MGKKGVRLVLGRKTQSRTGLGGITSCASLVPSSWMAVETDVLKGVLHVKVEADQRAKISSAERAQSGSGPVITEALWRLMRYFTLRGHFTKVLSAN